MLEGLSQALGLIQGDAGRASGACARFRSLDLNRRQQFNGPMVDWVLQRGKAPNVPASDAPNKERDSM